VEIKEQNHPQGGPDKKKSGREETRNKASKGDTLESHDTTV